jgi:hypothetical protein
MSQFDQVGDRGARVPIVRPSHSVRARRLAAAVLVCLGLTVDAHAQTVKAAELKAAFLANFSKFTEWPADALPAGGMFAYCVLDDKAMAAALLAILSGQQGQAEQAGVRVVKIDPSIRSCQVLYVGNLDAKQSAQVFDILKGAPVLTVGDGQRFAESGGIAQFILDKSRMRFAINAAAAQRARLVLSSKLLSLSTVVKDAGQ